MKQACLTHTLLLSAILIGGVQTVSYQQQAFAQTPTSEEKLSRKEKDAVKTIDDFLNGKLGWTTFTTTLAIKLQDMPQYVSFCKDLWTISKEKNLQTIGNTFAKYQNILPQPIKVKFEQYNTTAGQIQLGLIINKSFSLKN